VNVSTFVAVHFATQMAAHEKRVLEQLQFSGAQSSGSAMRLQLESKPDEEALARLLKKGRVVDVGNGTYYMGDAATVSERSRAVVLSCALLLLAAGAFLIPILAKK
jgi:hypothetical protein